MAGHAFCTCTETLLLSQMRQVLYFFSLCLLKTADGILLRHTPAFSVYDKGVLRELPPWWSVPVASASGRHPAAQQGVMRPQEHRDLRISSQRQISILGKNVNKDKSASEKVQKAKLNGSLGLTGTSPQKLPPRPGLTLCFLVAQDTSQWPYALLASLNYSFHF